MREVNVGFPVTKLAKWKTAFQMVALSMMMFRELWIGWSYLGEFLLWVAAVLTFITGYQYYQKSLDYVKAEEAKKVTEVAATVEVVAPKKDAKPAKTTKTARKKKSAKVEPKKTAKKSTKKKA